MRIHNKVYIGHVETIDPLANVNERAIKPKVVALKLLGFSKNNTPMYKTLKTYGEYYKLRSVEPITGLVTEKRLNRELKKTGIEEVKVLKKVS